MDKVWELMDELVLTKKDIAESTDISTQLLHRIIKGKYKGKLWSNRLADFAKQKAKRLENLAAQIEAEA